MNKSYLVDVSALSFHHFLVFSWPVVILLTCCIDTRVLFRSELSFSR
jgi:hypothetical protein